MAVGFCFAAGTRLLTVRGEVPVEDLREGESIVTLVGTSRALRPVVWIGRRQVDLVASPEPELSAPVRIRRDAFAENIPGRDVWLSPDHRVLVDGRLIPVRLLANGMTITHERDVTSVRYFHVELESHAIILAEGLPAETFLDELGDRSFFSNSDGPVSLQPNLGKIVGPEAAARACAPLAMTAAESEPAWRSLADRARALGFVPVQWDTTSDPDLRMVVDEHEIRPLVEEATRCVFALPAGTQSIRLASRASVPFDLDRAHEDWRNLGVGVTKLVYRVGADQIEIPADHPSLIRGWHDAETDGSTMWRWTNGSAHLPLPTPIGAGGAILELHLFGHATYAVTEEDAETQRRVA
ncbi:MAG: Hint domain-containing protein [Proteobacteria bacterium]|nr:Hint domain-containing protein [Pseudomonadota bacterium]